MIAGDGPLAAELRQRYESNSNITFLGHIDGSQVVELMSRARFTVIPSEWYENNPLGVIESLSAGTPVVGSDMGGIPELIDEHNGITFHHADVDALRHAITTMWDGSPDYEAIAQAARRRFSPEKHYEQITKIYRDLK
jgi:glycosyltransferase involved in cell wall biosynthesis